MRSNLINVSNFGEKLRQFKSAKLSQSKRNLLFDHFMRFATNEINDYGSENKVLNELCIEGKDLPRSFIPVLENLLINKTFGRIHDAFVYHMKAGPFKIEGKKVVLENWRIILRKLPKELVVPFIWTVFHRWFHQKQDSDRRKIILFDPHYDYEARMTPRTRDVIRTIKRWTNRTLKDPAWQIKIIREINKFLIPILLRLWPADYTPDTLNTVLEYAPKSLRGNGDWHCTVKSLAEQLINPESIRILWNRFPGLCLASDLIRSGYYPDKLLEDMDRMLVPDIMLAKRRTYGEGKTISTFGDKMRDYGFTNVEGSPLFAFFLGLLTRGKRDLIKNGADALGDPGLMARVRDSVSTGERVTLFKWMKSTRINGRSLWESAVNPNRESEQVLFSHLKEYFGTRRAINTSLERISRATPHLNSKTGSLVLTVGGCSFQDLKIKSDHAGCCYFKGGGYEDKLLHWLNSPRAVILYMYSDERAKDKPTGCVFLFLADRNKTLVVDSVEARAKALCRYKGWERWLFAGIVSYARTLNAERIVFNCDVHFGIPVGFIRWVKEHVDTEKNPKPVKLPKSKYEIPMEFYPECNAEHLSLRLNGTLTVEDEDSG